MRYVIYAGKPFGRVHLDAFERCFAYGERLLVSTGSRTTGFSCRTFRAKHHPQGPSSPCSSLGSSDGPLQRRQ